MKNLAYTIQIRASKACVWHNMLDPELYREWAKAFSADSRYEGEWKQGEYINFIDPNHGGTRAFIEELHQPQRIHAIHVGTISRDGIEDTNSESARKWMGTTESYDLLEVAGVTELRISISTHEDYEEMFNNCWPKALELIKVICER